MSKSARLRVRDVQSIYRFVGECRDLGDDPVRWRVRLLQGFRELVGADVSVDGEIAGYLHGPMRVAGYTDWGWEPGFDRERWVRAYGDIQRVQELSPVFPAMREIVRSQKSAALPRDRIVPDGVWYRSAEYELYRSIAGLGESFHLVRPIRGADGRFSVMYTCRATGCRPFTAREQEIARLLHAEVIPQIGASLASYDDPSPAALSPRLRQVLRCILEGDGDKQIAARLQISVYTVNQYVKLIFRHFGVQSRAELMARWVRRGWASGFAWATE
jgi:DNA-binding CsgD family transcriptional regulator